MTLWKTEYSSKFESAINISSRFLDLAGLIALATAPAFVLLILIPLPLVPPVLSLLSFVIACGTALYALVAKESLYAPGVGIWDVAGTFTFTWIVSGIISNPMDVVYWFDNLSVVP